MTARANTSSPPANATEAFIDRMLRLRWLLVGLVCLITAASLVGVSKLGVDNALDIWFVEGDPALEAYDAFQETFGNDEVVVMSLHQPGGILDEAGMARIRTVGELAAGVDGIDHVLSLATIEQIRSGDDWLEVARLYQPPIGDDFAASVLGDPLLAGTLVNAAGDTALVLAWMESMDNIDAQRDAILAELRDRISASGETVNYAGMGVVYAALNQASTVDSQVFIAASYLVIVGLLLLLFRRVGPVVLTMVVVGLAALWLMGLYGALGHDINMVTMVLPTLMLIIGVSDCIHFLNRAVEQPPGGTRWERARAAVAFMFWPCFMNSLTTAAGFAALSTASMPVVRDLGLFAAIGVMGAFVAALIGCSVGLLWPRLEPAPEPPALMTRAVAAVAVVATRRPGAVLIGALLLILTGALGITRLEVDTYSIDYLKAHHPVRQDSEAIEATFGNYTPLEIVVESPGALRDPAIMGAVARWQDAMEAHPSVDWTRSPADTVRKLNQVLSDGKPESFVVPSDPSALEQALLLYESDPDSDLSSMVSSDESKLRITAGIPMVSAKAFGEILDDLLDLAELPPGATITPGGYLPLYVRIMEEVVASQVSSFALAFLVIFVMLALLFRSIKLSALAIPANLVPVVIILGVMGLVGIRLDVATVTVSAIMLGLIVDDTTQFLYRFRYELGRLGDHRQAVEAAIHGVGRALLSTTVVLSLGFLVLGLAQIRSVSWFGMLMSLAMVCALLGDMLMLPAMIVLFEPKIRVK
jgi:predicted RND superfamily exporter protein